MIDSVIREKDIPLVSVVMPLFNKQDFVKNAIISVLNQEYSKIELIIVNDGSTDDSLHVVKSIQDPRVKIFNQINEGVSSARNQGVRKSSGDLIAFIDADDLWFSDHISVLVDAHKKYPTAGILCNKFVNSEDVPIENNSTKFTLIDNYVCEAARGKRMIWTSALVMRKEVFELTGCFPPSQSHGEDMAVWIKASLLAPVIFTDYVGAYYRKTNNGLASRLVNCPDGAIEAINEVLNSWVLSKCIKKCLMEYRTRISLAHIITACSHRNREVALQFLGVARAYPINNMRYYLILILACLPARLSGLLVKFFLCMKS